MNHMVASVHLVSTVHLELPHLLRIPAPLELTIPHREAWVPTLAYRALVVGLVASSI